MESFEHKTLLMGLLLIYILGVSYIGFLNRKSQNSEEYFLASRSLPSWLLAITFIASWWGGGSAIDLVDQAFKSGISSFWIYGVPVLLSTLLMYIFAKGIRRVSTISQSELMERRYDSRSSFMLTLFIIVFMTIGAAVQVIVIGNFFQSFLGLSYTWGAILGTLLVLFYSMFGGFKGVVLTDLLQFGFFLCSTLFLFILSYHHSGGFTALNAHVAERGIPEYTSFFHGLGDNMAFVITFGTSWMIQANVWQRISAARTPNSARKMMAISFVAFIPLYLLVTLTGMFSSLLFEEIPAGGIVSALLLQLNNPVASAIIFVGLCSAIMSTMDSMFNTGALSLTLDIYKRHFRPCEEPHRYVVVGRIATFFIAAMSLFIGVKIRSVLTISWIGADFIATGAFVPLVMGFLWRRGTSTAAFVSMLFGLLFSSYNLLVALGVGLPVAWEIASATQAIVGVVSSLIIYVVVSCVTRPDYQRADRFIHDADIIKR